MERVELSVEVRLEVRRKQLVCIIVAMVVECGTRRLGGAEGELRAACFNAEMSGLVHNKSTTQITIIAQKK
jgi:hypothetical protein